MHSSASLHPGNQSSSGGQEQMHQQMAVRSRGSTLHAAAPAFGPPSAFPQPRQGRSNTFQASVAPSPYVPPITPAYNQAWPGPQPVPPHGPRGYVASPLARPALPASFPGSSPTSFSPRTQWNTLQSPLYNPAVPSQGFGGQLGRAGAQGLPTPMPFSPLFHAPSPQQQQYGSPAPYALAYTPSMQPAWPMHPQQTVTSSPFVQPGGPQPQAPNLPQPAYLDVPSPKYLQLTNNGGRPTLAKALDAQFMPFVPLAIKSGPKDWGVVKISNIPYSVTKNEIYAFLGRHAKVIAPHQGTAVNIIMDRTTGKTMDCYVEFQTVDDAKYAVDRFEHSRDNGRNLRIGDRHVDVEVSSQEALMGELFPRAKCVVWHGQRPVIHAPTEPYMSGFRTFLTSEEIVMTVKHAETPQRSPFAQKCLQRTYESFVNTLVKFPWWEDKLITVLTRDQLFWGAERLILSLKTQLKKGKAGLDRSLLFDLVRAAVNVPGFSEGQKARLVGRAELEPAEFGMNRFARAWPWLALSRREGIPDDVVHVYANLLRDATANVPAPFVHSRSSQFGLVVVPWPAGVDAKDMTLASAAEIEWSVLTGLLRRLLEGPG
ncbi:MAG: hypothetical protein M1832_002730 [Thelocarpon impressellum]|nr:MAG: hypothetical protein M1832_002730 [Thelocarpon impressellum]